MNPLQTDIPTPLSLSIRTTPLFSNLRQVLRSIALIRGNNLPTSQLRIRVSRVQNLLSLHNRKRLESLVRTKLVAPSASNSKGTALDVLVAGVGGWAAGDFVGASGCGSAVVGVDGVGVAAGAATADALEVLHCPGGAGGHHGFVGWGWGWCREGAGGGCQEGEEGG